MELKAGAPPVQPAVLEDFADDDFGDFEGAGDSGCDDTAFGSTKGPGVGADPAD